MIKSNIGRALWEKFAFQKERYYGRGGIWSAGYSVSTVGLDAETIRRYVRYQEKEDSAKRSLYWNNTPDVSPGFFTGSLWSYLYMTALLSPHAHKYLYVYT